MKNKFLSRLVTIIDMVLLPIFVLLGAYAMSKLNLSGIVEDVVITAFTFAVMGLILLSRMLKTRFS